jgi:PAS domain S-box-containing protein
MDEAVHQRSLLADPALAALIIAHARDYAIMTMTLEGVITSWSPGAERIIGYATADAVGRHMAFLFNEADVAANAHGQELEMARQAGRAEDSRWHLRRDGKRFWGNGVTMRADTHEGPILVKIIRDETPAKLAEDQRILLLNELNHRIKNTLATVQSIAEQTLRAGAVDRRTRDSLTNRLIALSQAHNILVAQNWAGADLEAVIRQAVAPHYQAGSADVFAIDGPRVQLSPQQGVSLALAVHELATNALKYGALSVPTGRISISWNVAMNGQGQRFLNLLWEEIGGPHVSPPARTGFGTRLIDRSFGAESGGSAKLHYLPEGVRCVMGLPLSVAEEIPIMAVGSSAATASASQA